jgi:hypothetical protein
MVNDPESSWRDEDGTLRCLAFNVTKQGSCDAVLDERGECPRQLEHGDSSDAR